jgi:mono/diheme cytochrome c family protein
MTRWSLLLALATVAAPAAAVAAEPPAKATPEQVEFFEKKVRPILADNCYSCHGAKKQNGGLRLDTAAGLKAGADDGAVIVPGDPVKSRLLKSVRYENDFKMPPKKQLPAEAIAVLTEWVKGGAVAPEDAAAGAVAADPKSHWAFKPIKNPPVPPVADAATPDRCVPPREAH